MIAKTTHIKDTKGLVGSLPAIRCTKPKYLYQAISNAETGNNLLKQYPGYILQMSGIFSLDLRAIFYQYPGYRTYLSRLYSHHS